MTTTPTNSEASAFATAPVPHQLDIVSDVRFGPDGSQFLVSSWDNRLTLYDATFIDAPALVAAMECDTTALAIAYHGAAAYVGCIDGTVRSVDHENSRLVPEFTVSDGIDCGVNAVCAADSTLICTSFDRHMLVHDVRQRRAVHTAVTANKTVSMDVSGNYVVMGMSHRAVEVYDARNWASPLQVRESGLKSNTTVVRCFPDSTGFAVGSIDGRVSMEYFDAAARMQDLKYAFKCHRHHDRLTDADAVYCVNGIAFSAATNYLYTCGSDGFVSVWNWQKKRRIRQYDRFESDGAPMSVVKLDINSAGDKLVCATSDDSYKSLRRQSYDGSLPREPSRIFTTQAA